MNRSVFVVAAVLLAAHCLAKEIYFEFEHDPAYPQLVGISDISYNIGHKFIEVSGTLTIYEEIDEGTNVSTINEHLIAGHFFFSNTQLTSNRFSSITLDQIQCVTRFPVCTCAQQYGCQSLPILPKRNANIWTIN